MDEPTAQTPDEATFNENVKEVLHGLPQPIQDFLTGPERDEVTLRLTTRHNLHADQAGRFQKAFLFMLMGIFSPEQFAKDLADIGIQPETVRALANDVNEEVFKPLRAKEQQGSVPAVFTTEPVAAIEAARVPLPSVAPQPSIQKPIIPAPTYVPLQQQPVSIAYVEPPAPRPVYVVPPQIPPVQKVPPVKVSAPVAPIIPASPIYESAPQNATIRTMALDMQAVNEHKEPEAIAYQPSTPMPKRAPEPIQTPPPVPPPQNTTVPRADRVSPPSNLPGQSLPPLIKEYGADPYRESV